MENQKSSAQAKPLSLIDMSSAFVVLALGISLAVLVFLLETIYKHIKDRYSNLTENKPCGKLRIKSGKKVGEPKVGVKIVALEANNVIAVKPNVEVEAVSVQATGGR